MSNKELLACNPVFGVLPKETIGLLSKQAIQRSYQKDEYLSHAGDQWPWLFMIIRGSIQAVKISPEGRSLVVTTFISGDLFWGLAFFQEGMEMPVSLQVAEPAQILLWSSDSIIPIFMEHGSMSWEMIKLMITRMAHASQMLEDMSFQPVAGRLAKFLMETVKDEPLGAISRSLTLEEMAARIGSTREMVCRFLHRFADEGLIDITRTEFRVTDQKRLADFAQNPRG